MSNSHPKVDVLRGDPVRMEFAAWITQASQEGTDSPGGLCERKSLVLALSYGAQQGETGIEGVGGGYPRVLMEEEPTQRLQNIWDSVRSEQRQEPKPPRQQPMAAPADGDLIVSEELFVFQRLQMAQAKWCNGFIGQKNGEIGFERSPQMLRFKIILQHQSPPRPSLSGDINKD
ncbi:hypothetical protein HGM15179_013973 [Zosterops borbonicus]|uniref:Uncharacterized protein n=1 Tax=Zosterops borbonicus TaxID=364589 RepID=A0A8K1G745_9PASS|nr:hypothetical protein HGM15179_013973 [Zosterops borbonicus]